MSGFIPRFLFLFIASFAVAYNSSGFAMYAGLAAVTVSYWVLVAMNSHIEERLEKIARLMERERKRQRITRPLGN